MNNVNSISVILLVLACLIVVGSLGPWVTAGFISANGTDGDGMVTIFLGGAAAVLSALNLSRVSRARYIGVTIAGAIAAAVGVYDWADIANEPEGPFGLTAKPGWGLILMTLASVASVVLAIVGLRRAPASVRAAALESATGPTAPANDAGRVDPFKRG